MSQDKFKSVFVLPAERQTEVESEGDLYNLGGDGS